MKINFDDDIDFFKKHPNYPKVFSEDFFKILGKDFNEFMNFEKSNKIFENDLKSFKKFDSFKKNNQNKKHKATIFRFL